MTDNLYWQTFQPSLMDDSNIVLPQQPQVPPTVTTPIHATSVQLPQQLHMNQQQQWSNDNEKRKWSQDLSDFDMNSLNSVYNDHASNNELISEADSPDSSSSLSKRIELLSDSTLSQEDQQQRRKEQNRAAQRAFRERKERYVKELQIKIKETEKKHKEEMAMVKKENESLKALAKKMEVEISTLKGAAMAFDVSIRKLRETGFDRTNMGQEPPPQSDRQSHARDNTSSHYYYNNRLTETTTAAAVAPSSSIARNNSSVAGTATTVNNNDDEDGFAERESNRFEHKVDPIIHSGVELIPYSQIWERISQHPDFDEFDLDELCKELKSKAKCSGSGPVIAEPELQQVIKKYLANM